ncbi:receptor-like protein kinase FERONIA [Juglans microcarpa x Juglans regia]|uniref:receptor-like protein kinase FERONIA n=1 Tax=Juglans microcarpa x Juglans regia TaxID=2249226 RepID=UPI001B7F151E|nr:receptor-like protein kinase FERONIA [Juglans microcarpa x Juglans regia]
MWNSFLLPPFTPLYLVLSFLLHHLICMVSVKSSSPYTPIDQILLNCGSSGNSTALDNRTWIGDANLKFLPLEQPLNNHPSLTRIAARQSSTADLVPFATARISLSTFTYDFPVTAGQKFIRLYFYPASYSDFDRSKALFSVKAGPFTLLSNFNASLTADADGDPGDTIFREYCVNIKEDQRLNITFTPSLTVSDSYAFINGIEILSMPPNLYYTPEDDQGFSFIGQINTYSIKNSTALETVYRFNVGGRSISPTEDTGMFRAWSQDDKYLKEYKTLFLPLNNTINLSFTTVPPYAAPEYVYRTARTLGNNSDINLSYNLTWEFPVDSGFYYFIRLHFCEIQPEIFQASDRKFHIFIANQTAEEGADVILWSGGNGVPVYKDYAVSMFTKERDKKVNLYIAIGAEPQRWKTSYQDAIMNGIEIFKVSDTSNGNLAGRNPDPILVTPPTIEPPRQSTNSKNSRRTTIFVAAGGLTGLIMASVFGFLIFQTGKKDKNSGSADIGKSKRSKASSLPEELCRHFSLQEIKTATHTFHEELIIGEGGFGNVYKGLVDEGTKTLAIKRLNPESKQGRHEFLTEIEMLSQLRHVHLVSLIGYCNDDGEMILVYDYITNGTLRQHLYDTDNAPLDWKLRLEICIGAACGLNYLHTGMKKPIFHRDVKTTNILLDSKWVAKVSDFGLSKEGLENTAVNTIVKGTWGYLDPEYARRQQLTEKSDVYSFGVVLLELLCARKALNIKLQDEQWNLANWARKCIENGSMGEIIDPYLKGKIAPVCFKVYLEVAESCVREQGIQRPTMKDVMERLVFALQLQTEADDTMEKTNPDGEHTYTEVLSFHVAGDTRFNNDLSGHVLESDSGTELTWTHDTRLSYPSLGSDSVN